MGIKNIIKNNDFLRNLFLRRLNKKKIKEQKKYGDRGIIKRTWKSHFGYDIDLDNPKTLNEKIQWLKLNDRKDLYTIWADKYASREYIRSHFGEEYLIPLLFKTDDVSEINPNNIKTFPCVIKANHSSGCYRFLKNADDINWSKLRKECKLWLEQDYYAFTQEWQYKNIKRYILVEKMLTDKNGKIPNDYKLHFIEGKLAFVYCSIDRENQNYRQIYDGDWNILPFSWDAHGLPPKNMEPIKKPLCFDKMLEIGQHFADQMHYVRVDFYEVDGKLYCGEITLHHGSGLDKFNPSKYDLMFGELLELPSKNKN